MNDKTLIKFSLIWALIGIFALFCVVYLTSPQQVSIFYLDEYLGQTVIVEGTVSETQYRDDISFITLRDRGKEVDVVVFEELQNKVYAKDKIIVIGKVTDYKGSIEIVAEEIRCSICQD